MSSEKGGLVRFGEGVAGLTLVARDGFDYHKAPHNVKELEAPPACTLPSLAWNPDTGRMCRASLFHAANGVFPNAKFDECSGKIVGISHNWAVLSFYIHHNQHPYSATISEAALKNLAGFSKAIRDPQMDVQFPRTAFQPRRLLAFDPIRSRATKESMQRPDACRSLHHRGDRIGTLVPAVKSKAPSAAGKAPRSRPSASKAALRALALKAPMSTRVASSLFELRLFCGACNKINSARALCPQRSWSITEIVRRFGAKHPYAAAWLAVSNNITAPVVAGFCISNSTAASTRKTELQRIGTMTRGPGLYVVLNYARENLGGSLKTIVSTIFPDRPNMAAGVLACYGTKHTIENLYGKLSSMLRDSHVAQQIAEKGRFKYPMLLPAAVRKDADANGLSQHWWWAAIGKSQGPKPTLSSRWVIIPNRNDPVGSHTVVDAPMWRVLDAIRGGWAVDVGLAPDLDFKDFQPRVGANGVSPMHAAYEPSTVAEPYPEVLCAEYLSWWTLMREMENRRVAVNSADPTKYPKLTIIGSWTKAREGVAIKVSGRKDMTVRYGQCFQDLCRLAIMFKLDNFRLDLSTYADFESYPLNLRETVTQQAQQHRLIIRQTVEEAKEGASFVDKDGVATAERIFQDVFSRV